MQIHFYILASSFENTDIFTKKIVNESYGTIHDYNITSTIFYHPNLTFNKENECDMENTTNCDFRIFMRVAFYSEIIPLQAGSYSQFLIFDGFGTNMTYRGS